MFPGSALNGMEPKEPDPPKAQWISVIEGQIKTGDFGETIQLPSELHNVPGATIVQPKYVDPNLPINRKTICVYHAVYSAKAIEQLLEKGERVTSANIQDLVLKKLGSDEHNNTREKFGERFIAETQDLDLCKHVGLKKYYVVPEGGANMPCSKDSFLEDDASHVYTGNSWIVPSNPPSPWPKLQDYIKNLKSKETVSVFFLVSLSAFHSGRKLKEGHLVMVSYIKIPQQKPLILYIDRNNQPISVRRVDYNYPYHLYRFILYLLNPTQGFESFVLSLAKEERVKYLKHLFEKKAYEEITFFSFQQWPLFIEILKLIAEDTDQKAKAEALACLNSYKASEIEEFKETEMAELIKSLTPNH